MQQRTKKGFTLIELLIVIAIIGLLATLAIVSLTTAQRKARDTKRIADLKQLQNAVELFYSEQAHYPYSTAAINYTWALFGASAATGVTPVGIGNYITNVPTDPTNSGVYVYAYGTNTTGTEYVIGGTLEDGSHASLTGDDDTAYTTTELPGLNIVESDDAADDTQATLTCTDPMYCVSE